MVLLPAPAGPSMAMTRRLAGLGEVPLMPALLRAPLRARARVGTLGRDLDERARAHVHERELTRGEQRVHRFLDARARSEHREHRFNLRGVGGDRGIEIL